MNKAKARLQLTIGSSRFSDISELLTSRSLLAAFFGYSVASIPLARELAPHVQGSGVYDSGILKS